MKMDVRAVVYRVARVDGDWGKISAASGGAKRLRLGVVALHRLSSGFRVAAYSAYRRNAGVSP